MQKRTLICLAFSLITAASSRAESSRAGTWEVYGLGQAIEIFDVFESDADVLGGGLGVGYNVAEHFTLNADFTVGSADFSTIELFGGSGQSFSTTLYMGHLSADYNILKHRVTPLISLGLGFGAFSNGSGLALDQTVGVGLRWDATDHLVFKTMVRLGAFETTSSHRGLSSGAWASAGFSVGLGYRF